MTRHHHSKDSPQVLTITGSDSGGGASIQVDLATFAVFGTHGLCAITAVTAQNTRGVTAIRTLETAIVRAQIEAVFTDFRVATGKSECSQRRLPYVLSPIVCKAARA